MTKCFDNKLITLKNVMTDELKRLHNITEQEDIKLYELLDWVKEKMYRLTEDLDVKNGKLK
jgi:hypothetical protein